MSRIGWVRTGWGDPTNVLNFTGDFASGSYVIDTPSFDTAFAMRWKIKTYDYDYDFIENISGGGSTHFVDSGSVHQIGYTGDETGLPCSSDGFIIHFPSDDFSLSIFSNGGTAVLSGSAFFAGGLSLNPAAGPLTAIVFTFLGTTYPVYADPSITSATGTFDIVAAEWWEYDDGIAGPWPHGPIWDSATGAQLLDPIPNGR